MPRFAETLHISILKVDSYTGGNVKLGMCGPMRMCLSSDVPKNMQMLYKHLVILIFTYNTSARFCGVKNPHPC